MRTFTLTDEHAGLIVHILRERQALLRSRLIINEIDGNGASQVIKPELDALRKIIKELEK